MSLCDPQEAALQKSLDARNDLRGQLEQQRSEQAANYKEYWREVRNALAEFYILSLDGEAVLGGALGGYDLLFGVDGTEDKINDLHNDIEETKSDLADAEDAANADATDLCECWAEFGFE